MWEHLFWFAFAAFSALIGVSFLQFIGSKSGDNLGLLLKSESLINFRTFSQRIIQIGADLGGKIAILK